MTRISLRFGALVLLLAMPLASQVSTGAIRGLVTDSSGALIPKAEIKVVNEETNVSRALTTDAAGIYAASAAPPGKYRVEAANAGFQSQSKVGLMLSLDQTMVVDFVLQPGEQKQTITVVDRAQQLVQVATSSLGDIIDEAQIRALPLNGRNFQQLIGLSTGSQPGPQGRGSGLYNINGGRGEGNGFLIDGLDVSSPSNDGIRVFPNLEAIGEFKILTNNFSAEYGRAVGGIINTHIKSGSNHLHGTAFEYLRNRDLDARNFFDITKPNYVFNQFGGSAGGPVIRNKLFFFADYQGQRIRQGNTSRTVLPTLAARGGDLSSLLPRTVVYDPDTTPRAPFPNNIIPASRIDHPSSIMMSLLPAPNLAGPFNFVKSVGTQTTSDTFDGRVDYNWNAANRVSGVLTGGRAGLNVDPILGPLSGNLITTRNQNHTFSASLNYMRIVSPRAVNELVLGYKRDRFFGPVTAGMQYAPDLGVKYLNTSADDGRTTGFPLYSVPGYSLFGGPAGAPWRQLHNIPQLSDNFSLSKGRHLLKVGASWRARQYNLDQSIFSRGFLVFNALMTSNGGAGGDGLAAALLGYPLVAQRDLAGVWGERIKEYGAYFQDDYKVSKRLTLNLGLRYDLFAAPTEAAGRVADLDLASKTMILANQGGYSASIIKSNTHNFGPHVGFAYAATGDGKTVVRGGYGIGYIPLVTQAAGTGSERLDANPPFRLNFATTFNFLAPTVRTSDGLPMPLPDPKNPSGNLLYIPIEQPMPYVQQWNFDIQRALPRDFLVDLAYAGSRGVHLTGMVNLNQASPAAAPPTPRSRISPNFGQVEGLLNRESSHYHSLQAKIERRFRAGIYVLAAYTLARSIDDGSSTSLGSDASTPGPQDSTNWRAERAASDFDIRHRLVVSYIYALPFGKGRHFLAHTNRVVNGVLGGWQANGITVVQSGAPFTPIVANPRTNAGAGGAVRPDRIGSGVLPAGQQSIARWFDKPAFVAQGTGGADPYHFGNSGRNILRGPNPATFDFSLFKRVPITERCGLEFRTEFFNIFNRANFRLPNASVDTAQGGVITGAAAPRNIQFALKATF